VRPPFFIKQKREPARRKGPETGASGLRKMRRSGASAKRSDQSVPDGTRLIRKMPRWWLMQAVAREQKARASGI
jgi:hypothetical protein